MKNQILNILRHLLGRRNAWRMSRSLYLIARADSPNIPQINGEELLQQQLLTKFSAIQEKLVAFDVGSNVGDWTWFLLEAASNLNMEARLEVH